MTKIEKQILINQSAIMSALQIILSNTGATPMNSLSLDINNTIELIQKEGKK